MYSEQHHQTQAVHTEIRFSYSLQLFFSVLQKISSTLFLINAQQQLNILSFSWTDDQDSDGEDSRPLLDRVQLHSLEPWIETAALDRELH